MFRRSLLPQWLKKTPRPARPLHLVRLEDRVTPDVTASVVGGQLTIDLDNKSADIFLRTTATKIEVADNIGFLNGGGNESKQFDPAPITGILITSSKTSLTQTVTFTGTTAFKTFDQGVTISGADTVSVNATVSAGAAGAISITADGAITVGGTLASATGDITLTSTDASTAGQNITINGTVQSTGGDVALLAGDNLTIATSALVRTDKAGGTITLAVDTATADTVGGTASVTGTLTVTSLTGTATLTGDAQDDTFTVVAQNSVSLSVNGQANATTSPGDTLNFDAQNNPLFSGAGVYSIKLAKPVTYTNIETTTTASVGGTLLLGTAADDTVILKATGGGQLQASVNGGAFANIAGPRVEFYGSTGSDTLTVDYTGGTITLPNGILFDGEAGANDLLRVLGSPTDVGYVPDLSVSGKGTVTAGGVSTSFVNLTPIDVDGAPSFTFTPAGKADAITLKLAKLFGDPTKDAVEVAGTSQGVAFETVYVRNVATLTVNTTTTDTLLDADTVDIAALGVTPNVTNLEIVTAESVGSGTDVVTVSGNPGLTGTLSIQSNNIAVATNVTTGGSQNYNSDSAVLTGNAVFAAGSAAITVTTNTGLSGAFDATFNATGATTLATTVNIANLTTDAGGTTFLNAATFTASGAIDFNDPVSLSANVTVAAPTVTFDGTLSGAKSAAINATTTSFNGTVGGLTTLTTNAAGTTTLAANVTASTSVTFNDAVTLAQNVLVTAPAVSFNDTIDGAKTLTVNASGATVFGDSIGGGTALSSLTTNAGGTTSVDGSVTATGSIDFNDAVTVTADATFTAPVVSFANTLNGAFNVNVNASTSSTFAGAVGGTTPLTSLTTDAAGATTVGTNVSATTVTLNDAVTLTGNARFVGTTVLFNSTLNGAKAATVDATTTKFLGIVGGTTPLASLTTDSAGTTTIAANVSTGGAITFDDAVTVTAATTFAGGSVAFNATLNGAFDVVVNASGVTTFAGPVGGGTALTNLTTNAAGTTKVGANITATTAITFNDAVTLTGNTTVAAPTIAFNSTLNGAFSATVNATSTTFAGTVSGLTALTTNAAGTTKVGANIGATTITFNDPVTLTGNATFAGTTVSFNGVLDGAFDATVNATTTTFAAAVGGTTPLANLTTDAAGTTFVNGNVTASNSITFNDSVVINADRSFTANNVAFNGKLDGGFNVFINATTTTIAAIVGGTTPIITLKTDGVGTTKISGTITATTAITFDDAVTLTGTATVNAPTVTFSKTLDGGSALNVNATNTAFTGVVGGTSPLASLTTDAAGTTTLNGNVSATGAVTFNDAVTLLNNATITGSTVNFNSTLNGAFNATINAGTTKFAGTVGGTTPLVSLTTNAAGTTQVHADITASNAVTFNDAVTLSTNVTVTAPTVAFASTVDGAFALNANAADTTFGGIIGGTTPLTTLTTDAAGTTKVGASITATVAVNFQDAVTLTGNSTIAAPTVTFAKTLDGGFDATVNATATTFSDNVGTAVALANLTTNTAGTTTLNGNVTATGTVDFNDAVTLLANSTITGATVTIDGTLNGAFNATVNAGTTRFNATVGGVTPLTSLTTNAAGTTTLAADVTATTAVTFNDAVTLGANVTVAAPTMSFNSTLNGGFSATVNATTTTFAAAVGATTPLTTLKTDAAGITNVAANVTTSSLIQFGDDVTVTGNATFAAPTVTFDKTLNGAFAVVVNAGATNFNSTVGNATPLVSLTTDAAGTTTVTGNITATAFLLFNDNVVLAKDTIFTAPTVTFKGTLNDSVAGTNAATVNATMTTTFDKAVGNSKAIRSLATDSDGTTLLNGGSVTTTKDQSFSDAVIVSANTTFTATDFGNIFFSSSLNPAVANLDLTVDTKGDISFNGTTGAPNKSFGAFTITKANGVIVTAAGSLTAATITQTAGTGTTTFGGPVTSDGTLNLTNAGFIFQSAIVADGAVTLNATAGGISQTAGTLKAKTTLTLFGSGNFNLNQIGNDIGTTLATMTGNGTVTVRDANDLTINETSRIVTAGGNVQLNIGGNFTAIDNGTLGAKYTVPVIDTGAGSFTAAAGLGAAGAATVTKTLFNAEAKAASVSLGSVLGLNKGSDSYEVRPSAFTRIFIYASDPGLPLMAGMEGDKLLPLFDGTDVTNFSFDGQNGFYEFNTADPARQRKRLDFNGIDSLRNLSFAATAVLISEPGDGTTVPGTDPSQPQYAIRVGLSQSSNDLPSSLNGAGVTQNPFVVSPARVDPNSPFLPPQLAFAQLNSDGLAELVIANGPGTGSVVNVIDGRKLLPNSGNTTNNLSQFTPDPNGGILAQFYPYDPSFTGGINLAAATLSNTRGVIITAPDLGGGPQVRVFNYDRSSNKASPTGFSFFVYDSNFRGGVRLALGDVNGDGTPDLVVAPGKGGGPRIRVFDGNKVFNQTLTYTTDAFGAPIAKSEQDFFAYAPTFRGGVFIDVGDFNGDGKADLLMGAGRGGGDHIRVMDLTTNTDILSFFANIGGTSSADPLFGNAGGAYRGGVGGVAFGSSNVPGRRDIIVSSPRGVTTKIRQFQWEGIVFNTAGVDFFAANQVQPIDPSPSSLTYGATVEGFQGL